MNIKTASSSSTEFCAKENIIQERNVRIRIILQGFDVFITVAGFRFLFKIEVTARSARKCWGKSEKAKVRDRNRQTTFCFVRQWTPCKYFCNHRLFFISLRTNNWILTTTQMILQGDMFSEIRFFFSIFFALEKSKLFRRTYYIPSDMARRPVRSRPCDDRKCQRSWGS